MFRIASVRWLCSGRGRGRACARHVTCAHTHAERPGTRLAVRECLCSQAYVRAHTRKDWGGVGNLRSSRSQGCRLAFALSSINSCFADPSMTHCAKAHARVSVPHASSARGHQAPASAQPSTYFQARHRAVPRKLAIDRHRDLSRAGRAVLWAAHGTVQRRHGRAMRRHRRRGSLRSLQRARTRVIPQPRRGYVRGCVARVSAWRAWVRGERDARRGCATRRGTLMGDACGLSTGLAQCSGMAGMSPRADAVRRRPVRAEAELLPQAPP